MDFLLKFYQITEPGVSYDSQTVNFNGYHDFVACGS